MYDVIKINDSFETRLYKWEVDNPKYVMQIVHGSGEHAQRYDTFAKWLNTKNISVWSFDLRGHGEVENEKGNLGYFGPKTGKKDPIEDINYVNKLIKKEYPNTPLILLGHSMGSFLARMYAKKYDDFSKLILVGTNNQNKFISWLNYSITTIFAFLWPKKLGKFLTKMSYDKFNKKLKIKSEKPEWICTNNVIVDEFNNDILSGFVFTNKGLSDMAYWINKINKGKNKSNNFETLFIAGKNDPVGNFGKEVKKAYKLFKKQNNKAKIILYENMRHEILNEIDKEKVFNDIITFIEGGQNGY